MWGKNTDDQQFHYFESMADGRYRCGKIQRAKSVKAVDLPESLCPVCHRYYQIDLKRRANRATAAPTPVPIAATPNAQSRLQGIGKREQIIQNPTPDTRHPTTSRRKVRRELDREAEKQYLRRVLQIVTQETALTQATLRDSKQALRGVGADDFVAGAIGAWRVTNKEEALEILLSQRSTPYFARIDFQEENGEDEESFYIGRSTVRDGLDDLLVLDWRAPFCSMYYRCNVGPASYRAPLGTICGEILLKRQYRIEGGKLLSIYDAAGNLEGLEDEAADEMLLALLKRKSTGRMRQIVQSIQAEQDAIIRAQGDVLVVQGPAGSGKTIIALHRAAYLLYHLRLERERLAQRYDHLSAQRMIVFSLNSIFSDYISRVLPDLHEGHIGQVILEQHLNNELTRQLRREGQGANYRIETKEDYFESVLEPPDDHDFKLRAESVAFKASAAMLNVIEAYVHSLEQNAEEAFVDVSLSDLGASRGGARVLYSHAEMVRQFRNQRDTISLVDRIDGILKELSTRITDVSKRAYTQASTLRQLDQERRRFEQRLRPLRERSLMELYIQMWNSNDLLQRKAQEEPITRQHSVVVIAGYTAACLRAGRIGYEDIVPLLLISGYYRGFPLLRDREHAIVDEAQDYSLLHFEYIKRCLPNGCGLTIVGDLNQALDSLLTISTYDDLESLFEGRIKRLELTRSYRSSREITDFASRILPGSPRIDNVRRTGSRPKLVAISDLYDRAHKIAALLQTLAHREYSSVAILCKTRADCQSLYDSLLSTVPIKMMTAKTDKLEPGVCVMPVYLAKGLEFDVVIVHDAGQAFYHRQSERKILYTACTRALHELYVCYTGELSPLIVASPDLCDRLAQ